MDFSNRVYTFLEQCFYMPIVYPTGIHLPDLIEQIPSFYCVDAPCLPPLGCLTAAVQPVLTCMGN